MMRSGHRSKSSRPPARQNNVSARDLDKKTAALALHAYVHALGTTGVSAIARKQFVPRSTVQRVKRAKVRVNFYHALRDSKFGVSFITRFCRKYCAEAKRSVR